MVVTRKTRWPQNILKPMDNASSPDPSAVTVLILVCVKWYKLTCYFHSSSNIKIAAEKRNIQIFRTVIIPKCEKTENDFIQIKAADHG